MKKKSENIFEKLLEARQENLRMLITWRFKDLEKWKKIYYDAFEDTASAVIYEKFRQVDEAIRIKKRNEEQIWYFTI